MSSSDYAIRIKGLGKQYRIGVEQSGGMYKYKSLRDSLGNILRSPVQTLRNAVLQEPLNDSNSFWALKDVSFDVKRGEVVGIIGRNGAGKSTLLKILSRIIRPTTGEIELHGRVGSLLEVGTGFHPELSGRENIYLNGAILGMTRVEVSSHFDEIVSFSGVEKFLDLPVKQYSSGMYMRLAFAVAAQLQCEILIVDEVLAVGDIEFQRRCLRKMKDLSSQGRTVLFVSHNFSAVEHLCSDALLLQQGGLDRRGNVQSVLNHYQRSISNATQDVSLELRRDRTGTGAIRLTSVHIEDDYGNVLSRVLSGQPLTIVLHYCSDSFSDVTAVDVGISIGWGDHDLLSVLYASYSGAVFKPLPPTGVFRCRLDCIPLAPSSYRLGARVTVDGTTADWPRDGVMDITVEEGDFYGTGARGHGSSAPLLLRGAWSVSATPKVAAN